MTEETKKKNRYTVAMPITGVAYYEVVAESEDDAIVQFYENVKDPDVAWDYCEHVTQGNVFYGQQNDVEVQLVEEDVDDA